MTIAAGSGHVSTVRLLLESGVKPEDPLPSEHRTCPSPGMSAALHGRDGVLRILLNRGMRPDAMSVPSRWTPLMFAAAGTGIPTKDGSSETTVLTLFCLISLYSCLPATINFFLSFVTY